MIEPWITTMKLLAWSCVAAAVTACGAGSNRSDPPSDPIGFTFQTADGSLSSIGWTGVFHNIKGDPGAAFGVTATDCDHGVCQFEGPVDPIDPVKRRRCLYRTSTLCAADRDCPVDSSNQPTSCVYIYDSPLATPLQGGDGKFGACAFTYIPVLGLDQRPTIQGTLNLVSGEVNIAKLTVLLVLNANPQLPGTFAGVCPVCMGDPSPNDGIKGGTCQKSSVPDPLTGHIDPGVPTDVQCDVNRYGDQPGYNFGYSMDCSPTLKPNAGTPTPFGGAFSSAGYTISITDDSPACTDPSFKDANGFCGMCNDTSRRACRKQADCGSDVACVGASMPGDPSNVMNVPVAGNLCDGGVCNWNEAEGFGTCKSLARTIRCYPSAISGSKDGMGNAVRISVPGRAGVDHGVYHADTANAFCTPAGTNAAVNKQVGLPGLTFQKRNFRIIPAFPEDQK